MIELGENHYTPETLKDPHNWLYRSTNKPGMQVVVSPYNSACLATWAFRLNLNKGDMYEMQDNLLELNAVVVQGRVNIAHSAKSKTILQKLDSFYVPAQESVQITAEIDSVLYIGGAVYEGEGDFFIRKYEADLPLGEIHQIHGETPFEREVFMTVNQEVPASRLINGLTWGADGMWTSWPPHQHTKDLEEVYCYFDLEQPKFALHLSSRYPEKVEAVHPVSTGDFVVVPEGYHPTVSTPGSRSSYFWIMASHSRDSRRYDLAKADFGI